jgi:4-hydroxy-tetrahydrodipicolinate synthase
MTMNISWLRGCATALATPFKEDNTIDEVRFRALLTRQIEKGVRLLVPCGTTGETVTMTVEEDQQLIKIAVEVARELGAKVIAGTGSNDTMAAVSYTYAAKELGADAALVVTPYYNRPTQEGLFAHFATVAASNRDFPIILYNVPSRTASNLSAETTLRLANEFENIVGIKEASGDLSQVMQIIAKRPKGFKVMAGDDATALAMIAAGADGLVSVCSNQIPLETSLMVEEALTGDFASARTMHYQLLPLMEGNFIESSPAPCKFVLAELGLIDEVLRLPLVPVGEATREKLRTILKELRVIDGKAASAGL